VRVSPNELSFASADSWRAIYSYTPSSQKIARKAPFYEVFAAGFASRCVGSERDPRKHGEMRKMLNPAFSQKSLLDQETIINGIIDKFITICGNQPSHSPKGMNVTKWFEILTFDILGDMAFGESFHGLETGMILSQCGDQ
jgi:cytochrome P450